MANSIPVILIGLQGEMGRVVTQNLLPEIEVLHFISSPASAKEDLPRILNRQQPINPSTDGIGTQDYSREPLAILLGLGYYNEVVDDIRKACSGTIKEIPWFRGGLSKAEFDNLMATDGQLPIPQQGPITAGKVKKRLLQVFEDGKEGKDGVYDWWER